MSDAPDWNNVSQVTSQNNAAIQTSTPDWDNIQEVSPRQEEQKSSAIGRTIRWVMKGTPWEQFQTYNYIINKYKDSKGSSSDPKFMEQVKKDAAEYEDKMAARDPWDQLGVPMAVGTAAFVGEQFMTKTPAGAVTTLAAVGASGLAASKILPFKEWFNKVNPHPSPLVRDTVSIIDGIKDMAAMAGGAKLTDKQFLGKVLNISSAKPSVNLTPEHIEDIQTNPSINDRERKDVLKTLGIEDSHIKDSASTNNPINIPADKMLDLAKKPYYSRVRDIFNKPEEPKTSEIKSNLNIIQKGIEQGKGWGMSIGKGLNYTKRSFYNLFNSYMPVREKFGGPTEDPVFRAILTRDKEILGMRNQKSEALNKTFDQMKNDFSAKYSDEVLDDLMLVRGRANSPEAIKLQSEAMERLPEELKENFMQRAITEVSDYVRERIIKSGVGIDYHEDYIRGAYKWSDPEDAESFIDGYKNTDSFRKAKIYPTYADIKAKYPGIKLREPNPIKSLETEMRAGINRASMKYLKNQIMSEITGDPEKITNTVVRVGNAYSDGPSHEEALNKLGLSKDTVNEGNEFEALFRTNWGRLLTRNQAQEKFGISNSEQIPKQIITEPSIHAGYATAEKYANRAQRMTWKKIKDKEFNDMLFHPVYADFVNNLLATNKITQEGLTGALAKAAKFAQVLKFSLSAFHFKNISKAAIADEAFGIFDSKGYKNIGNAMRKFDKTDPEYLEYVGNIAGSHEYSLESDAQRMLVNKISDLTKNVSNDLKIKLGGAYSKTKYIPASPEMIRWMFDEYIPKMKFEKWKSEVAYQQERLGRPLMDFEKRDIARTIQNFYGEMNEKLFGRSGTVTSALRLIFSAPGYGEGNFRALFGSMAELRDTVKAGASKVTGKDFGKIPKMGYKNTQFITTSLINAMILGTIGTRILTGKWPSVPQNGNDVRDLFKIKTNYKDGNGDDIYFDQMDYANDFYSVYGNVLTGRANMIPETLGQRVTGAQSQVFQTLVDMSNIFAGRTIYDYRGLPVFQKTDDPIEKVNKYMAYRGLSSQPISTAVLQQYKQSGVPLGMSIAASISGTRKTSSEAVKISKNIRSDIFDLKQGKEKMQVDFNKLYAENPEEAMKQAEEFNNKQLVKANKLMDNMEKLGISQEDLQGTEKEVKDLFNSSLGSFLIKSVKNKTSGEKEAVDLTGKQQELLDKMSEK